MFPIMNSLYVKGTIKCVLILTNSTAISNALMIDLPVSLQSTIKDDL